MTVDKTEIEKFSQLSEEWWNEEGKFKVLHDINPVRIKYIKETVVEYFKIKNSSKPLSDLKILDIGCGGGLLSIPIRRLGATVVGVDPSKKNIKTAKKQAKIRNLDIDFRCGALKELIQRFKGNFDVVLNMEVVEHVADVEEFLTQSSKFVKNRGLIFIATINKTLKSLIQAKIIAEYILKWLPVGTHQWDKFLKPEKIIQILCSSGMELTDIVGMSYDLLKNEWYISDNLNVNYICCFQKV